MMTQQLVVNSSGASTQPWEAPVFTVGGAGGGVADLEGPGSIGP